MARPTYDITLCHADARRADAETLHDALVPHAKVWSAARSLRPGEPVTEAARAVESAGLVVVLVGGGDALDHTLGDALARAITATRADARRVVVPVYLDARGESHPLYGTAVLTGLALHRDGRDKVVEALRARVAGLRALWSARPRVALVGVVPEMENCLAAVATRLRPMAHEIEHFDACDPASAERARKADLRVMLVGARTGGTTVLRDLVDGGNFAMKLFAIDTDDTPDDELLPAKKLRARIEGSFDSVDEAAGRAQDHFARWLAAWVVTPPGTTTALEPWERSYLDAQRTRWTVGTHETLRDAKSGKPIPRASLYISLRGRQSHFAWEDASGTLFVDPRPKHLRHEPSPELADDDREGRMELVGRAQGRNNPWLEAVLSHRELPFIVVEGEAGAGKTVLLQHLACVLTAVHLGTAPVLHRLDLGAFGDGAPLLRVPLLVEARRLAPHLREGNVGELLAALLHEVLGHAPGALTAEALRDGMRAGRYVLLVDSLDEVPGLDARERIVRALDNLAGQGWPLRVVLTTRPTAHTGITLGDRLALLQVAPMDDDRVRELIDRWASVLGEDDRYRASAFDAVRGVRERQGVDPERGDSITANPLLLTCALLVFDQQRILPDALATLYERMVGILCRAKETKPASAEKPYTAEFKRQLIQRVCHAMQRAGSTALEVRDAAALVLEMDAHLRTISTATGVLDQLGADTGLLRFESQRDAKSGRERRVVRPWHRSFQEFLCACQIADGNRTVQDETDALIDGEGQVAFDPSWESTLGFLVGVYGDRSAEKAAHYVERLLERGQQGGASFRRGRLLGIAAHGVAEYTELFRDDRLRDALRDAIATRFAQEGASWLLRDRLLALEGLGRLGDPRLREDLWVDVPAGVLVTVDDEAYHSLPSGRVEVPAFRIAWRPITVEDYRPFVESGASRDVLFWADTPEKARKEMPDNWAAQRFHPNRPVVGVSHFGAKAWCRWASAEWGVEVDLPTQIEWVFAARRPRGDVFPWGSADSGRGEDAPMNDFRVRSASPVGAFPFGNRGRLVDLAGSIWEWTDSLCHDDDIVVRAMTGGKPRVVREGSRNDGPRRLLRAAWNGFDPRYRHPLLGFRVVVRVSRQHA